MIRFVCTSASISRKIFHPCSVGDCNSESSRRRSKQFHRSDYNNTAKHGDIQMFERSRLEEGGRSYGFPTRPSQPRSVEVAAPRKWVVTRDIRSTGHDILVLNRVVHADQLPTLVQVPPASSWGSQMDTKGHRSLVKAAADILEADHNPISDIVIVDENGVSAKVLKEGKWIDGRFEKNIRIDQPTHFQGLQGQPHASVYGRNRRQELVVVNLDGTGSHGTKGRLSTEDAEALKARGFNIRDDRVVEWIVLRNAPQLLPA